MMRTNIEQITDYMEYGSPLRQAFVIEAVTQAARHIVDNQDRCREVMADSFVTPEGWIACAQDWLARDTESESVSEGGEG